MAISPDLITSPGIEVWETCNALNQSVGGNTHDALRKLLRCERSPSSRFFGIYGQLNERFDVLEKCTRLSFSDNVKLRDANLAYVSEVRVFLSYDRLHHPWESIRQQTFDPNRMHAIHSLGYHLRDRFPLKRLTEQERADKLIKVRDAIKNLGEGGALGSVERSLRFSLETLAYMLEHYVFFGAVAVRALAEDIYLQSSHFERNPGRGTREQKAARKESCKSISLLTLALLANLTVELPIKANEWLTAIDELPPRIEALVDVKLAPAAKQLVTHATKLLTGPKTDSADAQSLPKVGDSSQK